MDSSTLNSSANLNHQAIEAALDSKWDEALKLNAIIIKDEPGNVDALNRQAHAYFELGNLTEAKKFYTLVLKYDIYNPIATKNLKIISASKETDKPRTNGHNGRTQRISPSVFLQEPGKTKVVSLLKVAEPQRLSLTYCGMPVELVIKNRNLVALDSESNYLGALPDDVSHQLLRLIKGGNKYSAFIKSIKVNGLSLLIRETYRSSRFRNQPSFLEFTGTLLPELITTMDNKDVDEEILDEEADS